MFKDRIIELRLLYGYSKQMVAMGIGVNIRTYRRYENGVILPSIETLRRVALFFNISSDFLLEIKVGNVNLDYVDSSKGETL